MVDSRVFRKKQSADPWVLDLGEILFVILSQGGKESKKLIQLL
jgi:hypothetical protein